jgi:hypothetical protein
MNALASILGEILGWVFSARFFKWVVIVPLIIGTVMFAGCAALGLITLR